MGWQNLSYSLRLWDTSSKAVSEVEAAAEEVLAGGDDAEALEIFSEALDPPPSGSGATRAAALFDAADRDKNGFVDFEEFCGWLFSDMTPGQLSGNATLRHLNVEMTVGDVLCYGLDEKLVCSNFRYEMSVQPDDETLKHLESRGKIYGEEEKKRQVDALEKALVDAKSKLEAAKAKAAKKNPKDAKKEIDKAKDR
eukprot:g3452.t1